MADVEGLVEELEKAEGPSLALDREILFAVFQSRASGHYLRKPVLTHGDWRNDDATYEEVQISGVQVRKAPPFTASIDACEGLFASQKEFCGELWVASAAADNKHEILKRLISAALRAQHKGDRDNG